MKKRTRIALVLIAILLLILIMSGAWTFWQERTAPLLTERTQLYIEQYDRGEGTLLLLHGLAGSGRYFSHRLEQAPQRQLLIPDLLGFGRSEKPKAAYSLDQHARLVTRAVEKAHPKASLVVLGHSTGGLIALEVARRLPQRVKGVVLISLPIYGGPQDAKVRLEKESAMSAATIEGSMWARALCLVHPLFRIPFFASAFDLPQDVYLDATHHSWRSLSGTIHNTLLAADAFELVKSLSVPLMIIHGDRDPTAPLQRAQALANAASAQMVVINGAGHHPLLNYPQKTWAAVDAFFQTVH